MKQKRNRWFGLLLSVVIACISINVNVYAAEDEIELDSDEQIEYVEGGTIDEDEIDYYVDGIYNTTELARATMSAVIRLAKSGTKLHGSYNTSYTYAVDKIGVKNVKLQYKSSLGLWYTLITIDNRYVTNDSLYAGSFTTTGTIGRTYRLKGTHYVTDGGTTQTRNNVTGELNF